MIDKSFLIFLAIAIPVIVLAYFLLNSQYSKFDVRSRGVIKELKPYKNMHNYYNVLLEYTYEGIVYREYSVYPTYPKVSNKQLEIGAEVTIYINSKDPTSVYLGRTYVEMGKKSGL